MYSSDDDNLIKISEDTNIYGLNSDDEYIYFISNNNLYRYHVNDKKLEDPIDLFSNAKYTFVINRWLYFSDNTLSNLYRINPVSTELKSLN